MVERKINLSYKELGKLIHKDKVNMLKLLGKKPKLNLSEIQRELRISFKETRRHIGGLVNAGLLKRIRKTHIRGSPVILSLKKRSKR